MNRNIKRRKRAYWLDRDEDNHYEVEHKLKELEQIELFTDNTLDII
jgi:hypothetical protein